MTIPLDVIAPVLASGASSTSPGARPAYSSAGAATTGSAAGTFAVNYPATVNAGDRLYILAFWRSDSPSSLSLHANAIAAGFTQIANFGSTTRNFLVAEKVGAGGEGGGSITNAVTTSGTVNENFHAVMIRITAANGFHATSPRHSNTQVVNTVNSTSVTGPNLTETATNQLAVVLSVWGGNLTTFSVFSGGTGAAWTERLEIHTIAGTSSGFNVQTAPGSVAGDTATLGASRVHSVFAFMLRPADI